MTNSTWCVTFWTIPSVLTVANITAIGNLLTGAMNARTMIITSCMCSTYLTKGNLGTAAIGIQWSWVCFTFSCMLAPQTILPGTLHSTPYHPPSQLQTETPFSASSQVPWMQGPLPSHPACFWRISGKESAGGRKRYFQINAILT